ncbi:unnamed protein product [Linum trigynum]|uniref:YDG domain-containing protein n=1 Tax=Linum trigynum TaxID=586398 RepID=A0AAV2DR97_9ROSI
MGFVENPVLAKSTNVVSSPSSGGKAHPEGKPVESGKSKYKRRKVSAIRHWPPNCGPQFRSAVPPPGNSVEIESHGGTDSSSNGGLDSKREDEVEVLNGVAVVDDSVELEKTDVKVGNEGFVDQSDDALEQKEDNVKPAVVGPKYPPRRKVSCVRHFPPNCGRNAQPPSKVEGDTVDETEEENRMPLSEKVRREAEGVKDVYMDGGALSGRRFSSNIPERVKIETKGKQFSGNGITKNPKAVPPQKYSSVSEKMMSKGKGAPSSSNSRVDESYRKKEVVSRESKKSDSLAKEDDQEQELDDVDNGDDYEFARRGTGKSVSLTSAGPGTSTELDKDRKKVKEVLDTFHFLCRKLLHDEGSKPKGGNAKRVDFLASKELKSRGMCLNVGKHIIGAVPGVEIGDKFQYRLELNVIGLHRPTQGGIDYTKHNQGIIATSIVASGGYDDNVDNSDVLEYTGQGGNSTKEKEAEDQKLERGNLALKTSITVKNPVRVIRGTNSTNVDARGRIYVYDGLYTVEEYWQETGPNGKLVFKFRLVRMPGQQELAWKKGKNSIKSSSSRGFVHD